MRRIEIVSISKENYEEALDCKLDKLEHFNVVSLSHFFLLVQFKRNNPKDQK